MKIIVKDTEPKVLSNGYENYEERKLDERNEDLKWIQQQAAKEPVADVLKIYENTSSWYNGKFGVKLIASLRKRNAKFKIEENWSSDIKKIKGDYIDFITSVPLIDQYPFHKCDNETIYIVPEGSTSDERPHDFLIWKGKAAKCVAIEMQDFSSHSKPCQKIRDFVKAQFITFNPPKKIQFIPISIAADQIKHEEHPSVIEQMLDWFTTKEINQDFVSEHVNDVPF